MEVDVWKEVADFVCICFFCCFIPVVMAFWVGDVNPVHGGENVAIKARQVSIQSWWHVLMPVVSVMLLMCVNLLVVDLSGIVQADQSVQSILQPLGVPSTYFESQVSTTPQLQQDQPGAYSSTLSQQLEDIKKQLFALRDSLASANEAPMQGSGPSASAESESVASNQPKGNSNQYGQHHNVPGRTQPSDVSDPFQLSAYNTGNFEMESNPQRAEQFGEIVQKLNEIQQTQQELEALHNNTGEQSMVGSVAKKREDSGMGSEATQTIAFTSDDSDFSSGHGEV